MLVQAGQYAESLVIDKAIELVGDAGDGGVVVKADGSTALTVENSAGGAEGDLTVRVMNITLQVEGGRGNFDHVVDNEGGSLHIEGCTLVGGYWGVLNSNSAVAVLVNNKVCCPPPPFVFRNRRDGPEARMPRECRSFILFVVSMQTQSIDKS